jgi:hypothetical protein
MTEWEKDSIAPSDGIHSFPKVSPLAFTERDASVKTPQHDKLYWEGDAVNTKSRIQKVLNPAFFYGAN